MSWEAWFQRERAFWGAIRADVVVTPSSVQTPLCTKLCGPCHFLSHPRPFLGLTWTRGGAGGDTGVPLLLRSVTRFGICSSGEQDFGSTAHDSEKERGSVSATALHSPEPCTVDWVQTDRPATWAGVGFHFAPYGLMVLNVSRSEEVPGAVRRRAPEMTGGKVLCSRTAESRDPHPKPRGSPVLQP